MGNDREGQYPKKSAIVLDTNVISYSKRGSFDGGINRWLEKCKVHDNEIIISQIAVYEFLRNQEGYEGFRELYDDFRAIGIGNCTPEVLQCALYLNVLYQHNKETQEYAKRKDILSDLLVGAIAGKHEKNTGRKTYVASCDFGFYPPYFLQWSYFPIPHNQRPERTAIVYLYEVNIRFANEQWKKFRSAAKQS